jgi:dipeptidase E
MVGKLFFYSDQVAESIGNRRLDTILFNGQDLTQIKIGYIPSTEDKEKKHFNAKVQYYRGYGVQNIVFFDLYTEFDPSKIDELLSCDIIHLSAGNPIEFRNSIKKRGIEKDLKGYFEGGGTLVGVSGGAVQFGQSAKLFEIFTGTLEDTLKCDKNLSALQFVNFEFLPHYNRWTDKFKQDVLKYSQAIGTTIYGGNDGDGIIVEDGQIRFVGDIVSISER